MRWPLSNGISTFKVAVALAIGITSGAQHPAAAAPSLRLTEGPISYQKTSL